MALIDCKLCGQRISSRAPFCPKCGCPAPPREGGAARPSEKCLACGLTGGQDDIYCNLCPDLVQSPRPGRHPHLLSPAIDRAKGVSAAGREPVCLVASKINGLQVGEPLRELFRLLAGQPVPRLLAGIPWFVGGDPRLAPWNLARMAGLSALVAGLCCGPLIYALLGLWRKGAVLALIALLLTGAVVTVAGGSWIWALLVGGGVVNLWACGMVTYDRYRNLVLDEEFWW